MKMRKFAFWLFIFGGFLLLESCNKDEDPSCTKIVSADKLSSVDQVRLATDIVTIDNYLASNSITAQSEPNGVRYVISTLGTGETPCIESMIGVTYTGRLLSSGNVFDSSTSVISFPLSNLILGWQLVLPSVPAGSTVTLYIPSGYGYGTLGGGGGKIPSNANLIFEIEYVGTL